MTVSKEYLRGLLVTHMGYDYDELDNVLYYYEEICDVLQSINSPLLGKRLIITK